MKSVLTILSSILIITVSFAQPASRYAYIERFKDIAISEMDRAGVPASIKLAQGILESNAGDSYLARKGNNHFGIKCGSKWTGKKVYRKDDDYNANGKLIESCFRVYKNPNASYVAHSDFLRNNPRYDFLFRLNPYDYKRWAHGLKRAGYATSATYAQKLIKVIEDYELHQYDQYNVNDIIVADKIEDARDRQQGIFQNNDIKLVLAKSNETPRSIADRTGVKVSRILKFNEELKRADAHLEVDERVYLQPKRNGYRGDKKYHYVQARQTLYDISQMYGVKLDRLRNRNRIEDNKEPAFGEKIKLRGFKVFKKSKPRTTSAVAKPAPPTNNTPTRPTPTEKPTQETDNKTNETPVEPQKEDTGIPNTNRHPVLTSDTGERDEDFYPPKKDTPTIEPNKPIEETPTVYTPPTLEPQQPVQTQPTTPAATYSYHVVDTGDTLYNISRRYGISVQQLMDMNNLTNTVIRKGQQLRVK